jgi:RNA methyltransferase, TrmH family
MSLTKSDIKFIQSLHRKKYRDEHQQFIIEGHKLLDEACRYAPESIIRLYSTPDAFEKIPKEFTNSTHIVEQKLLNQLSTLQHPQGILALCKPGIFRQQNDDKILVLDGIQDPGNMGTLLRTAAWFGFYHIKCSYDTVDVYNPKVVQSTMGAIFQVAIEYVDLANFLSETHHKIYGTLLNGTTIYAADLAQKSCVILGNEGNGIRTKHQSLIQEGLTIPRIGAGESLNVAVAGGIVMSEFARRNS